ncbi:MAG: hypothetical protein V7K92_12545 [Nostoc sp.]|uniref:hypothetical protein n=1 Tax=Nostoc sp. TaxID=1180 RepID=UPI002FF1B4A5
MVSIISYANHSHLAVDGSYQLQIGQPFFMPEINLGIGRSQYISGNIQRQLYWYDQQVNHYQTPEEVEQQTRQQLELVRQKLECSHQQFGELPEA